MGAHPANLVIRFILEMTALFAMGYWGWQQREDLVRYLLAVLVPLVAASLWGLFAVPGDASRSGRAPVAVSGPVRLVVEVAFFTFGVFTAHQAVNPCSPSFWPQELRFSMPFRTIGLSGCCALTLEETDNAGEGRRQRPECLGSQDWQSQRE
jgi:hypothetical protein